MQTAIVRSTLIVAAAIAIAIAARLAAGHPLRGGSPWGIDVEFITFAVIELLIPLMTLLILTTTQTYRTMLSGRPRRPDKVNWGFWGTEHPKNPNKQSSASGATAWILLFLLHLAIIVTLIFYAGDHGTLALLFVIVAGLVGGWRVGLAVGLLRYVLWGALEILFFSGADSLSAELILTWGILKQSAMGGIWIGLLAGLLRNPVRFSPLHSFAFGLGANLFVGLLINIGSGPDVYVWPALLPVALVEALALAGFALMEHGAQAQVAQQRAEAAERARLEAEVLALRSQINPHFLFNALNTIRHAIRKDPTGARRLLLNLSDVFQRALRSGDFVTLEQELEYVRAYLNLEHARLGERLKVEINASADLHTLRLPTLILQPLVENAVQHGIAKQSVGGTVSISATRQDDTLILTVSDDGAGMSAETISRLLDPTHPTSSVALRNITRRLDALYGSAASLHITSDLGRGTTVTLTIPITETPS